MMAGWVDESTTILDLRRNLGHGSNISKRRLLAHTLRSESKEWTKFQRFHVPSRSESKSQASHNSIDSGVNKLGLRLAQTMLESGP